MEANLRLTYSIAIIASLGFLGFATSVNAADWGLMIQENRWRSPCSRGAWCCRCWPSRSSTIGTGLVGDGLARAAAGIDRKKAT